MEQATYTFEQYLRAYGRVFFRTAPWVTLMSALMFFLFLSVPQAGELILSQATRPPADEASGGFYWRMLFVNLASAVLALSFWLSGRMLVHAETQAEVGPPLPPERQARLYVPRQLGLSVFLMLQVAAASSLSQQGYALPIALVCVWLVVLSLGLLRLTPEVEGDDLRAWWMWLLAAMLVLSVLAFSRDWAWLQDRNRGPGGDWVGQQENVLQVLGITAVAVSALLCLASPLITCGRRSSWAQAGMSALALAALGGALYATGLLTAGDMYWLFFLAQSLMAFAYWLAVARRREFAQWMARNRWLGPCHAIATRNILWAVFVLIAASCVLLAVWAAMQPIAMGSYFGAMGIVLMFLAMLVLLVAIVQAQLAQVEWGRMLPAGTVVVALLGMVFYKATPPEPPRAEDPQETPLRSVDSHMMRLPDEGVVFAVAAHGGGIRAAQYTAAFAAWLDHETDYRFSKRLVAASGASGGSVGLAVWSAARAAGCAEQPDVQGEAGPIPACVHAVNQTLTQDHLGPLIATGLFRDYPLFLKNPERGKTLQDSILHAASRVDPRALREGDSMRQRLRAPLPYAPFPLLLNAASVGTARPFAMVTRKDMLVRNGQQGRVFPTIFESGDSDSVSLLTAAMHSARFPLVSPKGLVAAAGPAVVDGGYFDNSGVAVLRQFLETMPEHRNPGMQVRERLVVLSVDSEPIGSTPPPLASDGRNSFDEVVATLMAARSWHGMAAWLQLCRDFDDAKFFSARPGAPLWPGCEWPSELTVQKPKMHALWQQQREARAPALGWHLSRRSALRVSTDARDKAIQVARELGMGRGESAILAVEPIQRAATTAPVAQQSAQ